MKERKKDEREIGRYQGDIGGRKRDSFCLFGGGGGPNYTSSKL